MTAKFFLLDQINALATQYEVSFVTNLSGEKEFSSLLPNVKIVHVPIIRKISLYSDIKTLFLLYNYIKSSGFDLVHSVSPKAGLLAMLAARFARVSVRLHTYTGQVWVTKKGFSRWLLKTLDKIIFNCATNVLVDSHSQRNFLLHEGVINDERSHILGAGSISGVDSVRFKPDAMSREKIRRNCYIPQDAILFLFLGRIKKEKGVFELCDAFEKIALEYNNTFLALVGPDEEDVFAHIKNYYKNILPRIVLKGYTSKPENFMAAADILCLPSHREGFGSVIIEAAAVGIPSMGSNIYGISDAIIDKKTGLIHKKSDSLSIYNSMKLLLRNPCLTKKLGQDARDRALKYFSKEILTEELFILYDSSFLTPGHSQNKPV
ncbi:MAG: glycosyltransferase family 4 protein [Candidatus Brocadiaceae bacterium]|nr:glycosyltransferase family 4 protein [Candidatus Brocadiaceae bacterium]